MKRFKKVLGWIILSVFIGGVFGTEIYEQSQIVGYFTAIFIFISALVTTLLLALGLYWVLQ